jgi:hypothetical protein
MRFAMAVKQKPEFDLVKRAADLIKKPEDATKTDIKRMASRILDDERNAPTPNKTVPKPAVKATLNATPPPKRK